MSCLAACLAENAGGGVAFAWNDEMTSREGGGTARPRHGCQGAMEAEAIGTRSFRRTRGSEKAARCVFLTARGAPEVARAPRSSEKADKSTDAFVFTAPACFFGRRPRMRQIAAAALAPRARRFTVHTLHNVAHLSRHNEPLAVDPR